MFTEKVLLSLIDHLPAIIAAAIGAYTLRKVKRVRSHQKIRDGDLVNGKNGTNAR